MSTVSDTQQWFRRGWDYYRRYTKRRTGVHAAATAALTGFGLLATFERWFVVVAIVAYLAPPVYLYLAGDDLGDHESSTERDDRTRVRRDIDAVDADRDVDGADADFDIDGIDGDADADGADADADGADADADGIDVDVDR